MTATPAAADGGRRPIVVGVDGSAASDRALGWAAAEAQARGGPLTVVYGWSYDLPDTVGTFEAHGEAVVDRARQQVSELAGPAVTVATSLVPLAAAQALVEASQGAELLVVGSRGRGGFTGLLLGSVSQQCALHAHCPVVIVREDAAAGL